MAGRLIINEDAIYDLFFFHVGAATTERYQSA
jgi:hypothetical protein